MAQLEVKLSQLKNAISSLEKSLNTEYSEISRDASIQRFEYTFELLWKVLKVYLLEIEGIECHSPKSCFREIRNIFKLTEKEIENCLNMSDDRNISVHTYSEKMANLLYKRLDNYYNIIIKIVEIISNKIK